MRNYIKITSLLILTVFWLREGASLPLQSDPSALAEGVAGKLQALREHAEQGNPEATETEISEQEFNAYLLHHFAHQLPEGVDNPWVRFSDGPTLAGATLDLDVLKTKMPESTMMQYLSGRVPLEMSARFQAVDGVGRLELESVTLSGLPIPLTLIQQLVTAYTKGPSRPNGFRLDEPFALPYEIDSVQVLTGRMILRQTGASDTPVKD
jgi:hypothetical protein